MAQWIMVKLADRDAAIQVYRLRGQFKAVFETALAPAGAALFSNEDHLRRQYTFYFSPKAAEIFKLFLDGYGAQPCETPARDAVNLEIGQQNAVEMLLR